MMKKGSWIGGALALVMLAVGAAPANAQALKLGYINSQKILAEAPGAREAQAAFERDMGRYRTQVDSLERELERLQADFDKQQATLSATAKQQRQQEMQTKFVAYQQRVGELERTAQQRQQELVQPIMKKISDTIELIRKEGGYSMIFDASAGALITADPALDLTDRVLARMRGTGR
jgi:outer membrane protein